MPTSNDAIPRYESNRPTRLTATAMNRIADRAAEAARYARRVDLRSSKASRIIKSPFWAQIVTCNYDTGMVTVREATGTLPSLTVLSSSPTITAYQGDGWHIVGDFVRVEWNGPNVTPEWTIEQRIAGTRRWPEPDAGSLASPEYQDVSSPVTGCG